MHKQSLMQTNSDAIDFLEVLYKSAQEYLLKHSQYPMIPVPPGGVGSQGVRRKNLVEDLIKRKAIVQGTVNDAPLAKKQPHPASQLMAGILAARSKSPAAQMGKGLSVPAMIR